MSVPELSDQEMTERYQPWAVEFIKKHGKESTGIDSLRHHSDYMMAKGDAADIYDLQIPSRLFNQALEEHIKDVSATMNVGSCSSLISHMLSALRLIQKQSEKTGDD